MPPRRLRRGAVERLVANRVAEALAEYEQNWANARNVGNAGNVVNVGNVGNAGNIGNAGNVGGPEPKNTGGAAAPEFEKMESVSEISMCAEEDKVKFAICTLEGRALTW
ncbi:hypothetical protein Tco_0419269 [Tanacetum coccineum]